MASLSGIITVMATSLSTSLLAFERYIDIVHPYLYIRHFIVNKSRVNFVAIWIGSITWVLLCGLLYGREAECHSSCHTCFYIPIDHHQLDILELLTVVFFICVLYITTITTLTLYGNLFQIARKHIRAISA